MNMLFIKLHPQEHHVTLTANQGFAHPHKACVGEIFYVNGLSSSSHNVFGHTGIRVLQLAIKPADSTFNLMDSKD